MGNLYPGQDPPPPASTAAGARIQDVADDLRGPGPYVMSCANLAGDPVIDARGEDLGKLDHVMLDVPSGRIAYGVLARGGVFGIGERLFAIPWDALTLDVTRKCFVLDVDRDRLERAPGFDRDHWPAMADAQWATRVHDHFGVAPYWSRDPVRQARRTM
jgi:sporulation protein YlmC with PRC-barrel domain